MAKEEMTDKEHAKKYAEESISLAISMSNPKAEDIAYFACLYGLTYKNDKIKELKEENTNLNATLDLRIMQLDDSTEIIKEMQSKIDTLLKENTNLTKARELILKLYNAGRDVLMCRAEEKAYDNLSNAINDRSIERFLKETEK